MAAELSYRADSTGSTLRATIRKELTVGGKSQMWNGSAWEDLTVANWATYLITLTETPASSYVYIGTWPAALTTAGWYYVDIYGGTTISSVLLATLFGYWDGTAFRLGGADVRQLGGNAELETGVTLRQALQRIAAATAGKLSGAGTGTETLVGMDGATVRIEATVNALGDRTAITYDP